MTHCRYCPNHDGAPSRATPWEIDPSDEDYDTFKLNDAMTRLCGYHKTRAERAGWLIRRYVPPPGPPADLLEYTGK